MRWDRLHRWEVTPEEAERIQRRLGGPAREPKPGQSPGPLRLVAGAAVSGRAAAVAVLETEGWSLVEGKRIEFPAPLPPYRAGLMAFAFGPALLQCFEQVESKVQLAIFHAHGLAHPRRCGMATHLGLLLSVPSLGCADRLICGQYAAPGPSRGDWMPVTDEGEIIGAAVRTRQGSRPLLVSPGYALTVEEAVQIALRCARPYRWPEPLRRARLLARGE
jgi:deoxyribonuclease V